MSQDTKLRLILSDVAQGMLNDAEKIIKHNPSKGREREAKLLSDYLNRFLPRNVQLINGAEIITTNGDTSNECDIVITDQRTPPFYSGHTFTILPIETVYGVIEVKSKLNQEQLTKSFNKLVKIKQMPKTAFYPNAGDIVMQTIRHNRTYDYFPTMTHIFAYKSIDLDVLALRLKDLQKDLPVEFWLDGIYCLDKGVIIYLNDTGDGYNYSATSSISLIASCKVTNSLLPMTMMLQNAYSTAHIPNFKVYDYIGSEPWVKSAKCY